MLENLLIAGLARRERMRLVALSDVVPLHAGEVLCESGERARHVYFPLDGNVALVAALADRRMLGIGMVGREGMLGAQLAVGVAAAPVHAVVLGAGAARRVDATSLRRELAQGQALQRTLQHYLLGLMTQFATAAACSCFHLLRPRLARWLLMSADRMQADNFRLTHEVLARMLGVRREGISVAAAELQQRLLIRYHRGDIRVLDRPGLELEACSCHGADRLAYGALAGLRRHAPQAGSQQLGKTEPLP